MSEFRVNCGKAAVIVQAVRLLEKRRLKDDAEERKWKSILIKLYLNLSLCNLRLRKPTLAITHSRSALALDIKNVKAIFRLGQVKSNVQWTKNFVVLLHSIVVRFFVHFDECKTMICKNRYNAHRKGGQI